MELRHFRCFMAVADCLHFVRAAELLHISPPALTKQIQEAERMLGVRLFHRTTRSVSLTSAGEVFQVEARRALEQFAQAEESVRRAGRGEIGRIEVGYIASTAYSGVLQAELSIYRKHYPDLEVNLREGALARLPQLIEAGTLDVAFLRPPVTYPVGIDGIVIARERFVLALHAESPLARLDVVHPAQLRDERFILPEQESGTLEIGRRGQFHPQIVTRPGRLVAVVTMVSLGSGVAVVPHSVVDHIVIPDVVYREIHGGVVPTEIAVAHRRHEKAPAVRAFIRQVRERGKAALA
ncbi:MULTISPECIES: LysR family transcriptional regulator [Cupriavidus]